MRSFTPKVIAAAAMLAAVPFTGAYAAQGHHHGSVYSEPEMTAPMPREAVAFYDQLQGVRQGIGEALDAKAISPAQARNLTAQTDRLAMAHGRNYRALLGRLENIDQRLRIATGEGYSSGSVTDGGYYPDG